MFRCDFFIENWWIDASLKVCKGFATDDRETLLLIYYAIVMVEFAIYQNIDMHYIVCNPQFFTFSTM